MLNGIFKLTSDDCVSVLTLLCYIFWSEIISVLSNEHANAYFLEKRNIWISTNLKHFYEATYGGNGGGELHFSGNYLRHLLKKKKKKEKKKNYVRSYEEQAMMSREKDDRRFRQFGNRFIWDVYSKSDVYRYDYMIFIEIDQNISCFFHVLYEWWWKIQVRSLMKW